MTSAPGRATAATPTDPAIGVAGDDAPDAPADLQVVVPLFDDWESARRLLRELDEVGAAEGLRLAVLLVDDGSEEPCPITEAPAGLARVEVLSLKVNQGHVRAIAIGLSAIAARGEAVPVAVMDGDGEDRPAGLPLLLARSRREAGRVVVAERRRRSEPLGFRVFYALYKAVFRLLTGRRMTFGNFCLLPAAANRRLVERAELWNHLAGTLLAGRWQIERLPLDRGRRYAGRSKMNLPALIQHGLGAVAVDLDRVLIRLLIFLAVLVALLGALLAGIVGVKAFSSVAVPGWATTAFGLTAVLLLQTVVFAFLLLFVSLRTRGLQPVVPAWVWQDYVRAWHLIAPGRAEAGTAKTGGAETGGAETRCDG